MKIALKLLACLIFSTFSYAMETKEQHDQKKICACSRWDTLKTRIQFLFDGYNSDKRDSLLLQLMEKNNPANLNLINSLLCANKSLISGAYLVTSYSHPDIANALEKAIRNNSLPVVKAVLNHFDISKGMPIRGHFGQDKWGNCPGIFKTTIYSSETSRWFLEAAVNTSEEMTQAIVDSGIDLVVEAKRIENLQNTHGTKLYPTNVFSCAKEPGCAYLKKAYEEAKKERRQKCPSSLETDIS